MNSFVALPVGGDAFLIDQDQFRILVDSGSSGKRLVKNLIKHTPSIKKIDIAVCTHADLDHAGGFIDALEEWEKIYPNSCLYEEIWLPGVWSDLMKGYLDDPKETLRKLVSEMDVFPAKNNNVLGIQEVDDILKNAHRISKEYSVDKQKHDATDVEQEKKWVNKEQPDLKRISSIEKAATSEAIYQKRQIRRNVRANCTQEYWGHYWIQLIETSERIRKIYFSALKHGVTIRLFDYTEFENTRRPMGGNPDRLIPLNSVEQFPTPRGLMYCQVARLSVENEQSLVFLFPGCPFSPQVLFCGDSPLGDGNGYQNPFFTSLPINHSDLLIITAPHHGSESNAIAYQHIQKAVPNEHYFWVRSGGTKKHPGPSYKSIPLGLRACTHCPQRSKKKAPVIIKWLGRMWLPPHICTTPHMCNCT